MAAFVGPRCMIRCALALALGIACTPALAVAAPPSPAPAGPTAKPGRGAKSIPPEAMPTTAPDMLMMADTLVRGGHVPLECKHPAVARMAKDRHPDVLRRLRLASQRAVNLRGLH